MAARVTPGVVTAARWAEQLVNNSRWTRSMELPGYLGTGKEELRYGG
jgi:hypothetical protein